ncbi:MAG: hypothetical protein WD066_11060 [Planctomycetaceae bacterium]
MPVRIRRLSLLLAALSASAVVASAQSESNPSPDPAAAKSAADKLVGVWVGSIVLDEEKLSRQLRGDGIPADRIGPAVEQAAERVRQTTLELEYESDGTYRAAFRNGDRSETNAGKWEVVGVSDGIVTVRTTSSRNVDDGERSPGQGTPDVETDAEGKEAKVETFTLELIDADHIRMKQPRLEKAHIKHFDFTRKKPDADASQPTNGRLDS